MVEYDVFDVQMEFAVISCLTVGQREEKLELQQYLWDNESKQGSQYLFMRLSDYSLIC